MEPIPPQLYDELQRQFWLAILACSAVDVSMAEERISKYMLCDINDGLKGLGDEPWFGNWEVVWGPSIFKYNPQDDNNYDNAMYVAYNEEESQYAICIAGTPPEAEEVWINQNLNVSEMIPWNEVVISNVAHQHAKISQGTWNGLQILLDMRPALGMPGWPKTLVRFLNESIDGTTTVKVTTNGFSLGGALSPTLALWLRDTQAWAESDNVTISTWPFAGATTGNSIFKEYSDSRLPESYRVVNTLDAWPRRWDQESLESIKTLYDPDIPQNDDLDSLIDMMKELSFGKDYQPVGKYGEELEGTINTEIISPERPETCDEEMSLDMCNYFSQWIHQHVTAYFSLVPEFVDKADHVSPIIKQLHSFSKKSTEEGLAILRNQLKS